MPYSVSFLITNTNIISQFCIGLSITQLIDEINCLAPSRFFKRSAGSFLDGNIFLPNSRSIYLRTLGHKCLMVTLSLLEFHVGQQMLTR